MISENNQISYQNQVLKSAISSNLSFFKGKFEELQHFYKEKERNAAMPPRKRLRTTSAKESRFLNPADMSEFANHRNIIASKTFGVNNEMQRLSFKNIDQALCSLRGDVGMSEFFLVISPEQQNACNRFEMHGVDKTSRKLLGTVYVSREDLKKFEEDQQFYNYSMIVCNTPIDLKTSLELFLNQFEENKSECSPEKEVKIEKLESEPTLFDLLKRLDQNAKTSSDLTKFFNFAEKNHFSIIIRPDFVKFSNQLILDFFLPDDTHVGTFTLTNKEIEEHLKKHKQLLENLKIVEDTNEIVVTKAVAKFLRRFASSLNLIYIYDIMSELIYKIYANI